MIGKQAFEEIVYQTTCYIDRLLCELFSDFCHLLRQEEEVVVEKSSKNPNGLTNSEFR